MVDQSPAIQSVSLLDGKPRFALQIMGQNGEGKIMAAQLADLSFPHPSAPIILCTLSCLIHS
jgi:hypothetical protein